MKESESSSKKLKEHDSSYYDPSDYIPMSPTLTQLYDHDSDDNDQSVMQSRVPTCSFCHKQHASECCKRIGRCLSCGSPNHFVGESPKNPYINPTTSASTQFSRNEGYSTQYSRQTSKPGK
ncbi:hypothetical protein V6N13_074242 [Hibiscus sabdariffa]|uniref:Uncharacterized protein n=1 Tax=Hibiscus sabdariffa TaxID=183260 RepID=A0ABR2U832_9ROSI